MSEIASKNKQINKFLQGKRDLALPFDLMLAESPKEKPLHFHCLQALNILPEKRLVLKAVHNKKNVLIKFFPPTPKGDRQYKKELRGHALTIASGVSVPKLIAAYENMGEYYSVIYQFLDDAKPFSDQTLRENEKHITGLFKMMVAMHEYGIYQKDIHLDNVLLNSNTIYLIDFGSVRCEMKGEPLRREISLKNLTKLVANFPLLEQTKLTSSIGLYYQLRQWQWDENQSALFTKRLSLVRKKRRNERQKDAFKESALTKYGRDFSTEYAFRKDLIQNISTDNLIKNIEQIMPEGKVLKSGNSVTVAKVTIDGMQLVIKRYRIKNKWQLLSRCWQASRAATLWKNASLLDFINLPTLKPLGFIERRTGWFKHTSYLISQYEEIEELQDVYQHRQPTEDELGQIKNIFLLLQNSQMSHGDLNAQNLVINTQGEISLVGLDAMQEHKNDQASHHAANQDKKHFMQSWKDSSIKKVFESIIFNNKDQ